MSAGCIQAQDAINIQSAHRQASNVGAINAQRSCMKCMHGEIYIIENE